MGSPPIGRSSRGASLQVSTDGGNTWIAVAQLRTIAPSGKRTQIVDQTNLLTVGNFTVKLAVQVDAGSVAYDGVLNPTDAGLNLLSSLQDGLTLANFRILLPAPPNLTFIEQTPAATNVSAVIFSYTTGWVYEPGDVILDSGGHLQQAQYSFTAGGVSSWNHSGGYTNDSGGTLVDAWLDLGAVAGLYPVLLEIGEVMAALQPGMLLSLGSCSVSVFNGGPFPVLDYGPYPGASATKLVYLAPLSGSLTFDDTVTIVTLYRASNPTIHSFQGFVTEHVPAKLGISKICAFSGKIDISGPITTVLGDPWPGPSGTPGIPGMSGGSGGVSGWLAPVWTTYSASGVVPTTAQAIKALGGSGGIALTLTAGGTYYIVKDDNTAGPISLTFGGVTIYELTGYRQFVILSWDGSEFMEMAGN